MFNQVVWTASARARQLPAALDDCFDVLCAWQDRRSPLAKNNNNNNNVSALNACFVEHRMPDDDVNVGQLFDDAWLAHLIALYRAASAPQVSKTNRFRVWS